MKLGRVAALVAGRRRLLLQLATDGGQKLAALLGFRALGVS